MKPEKVQEDLKKLMGGMNAIKIKKTNIKWGEGKHYRMEYSVIPVTVTFQIDKRKMNFKSEIKNTTVKEIKKKKPAKPKAAKRKIK